jgi:hypothetical protein
MLPVQSVLPAAVARLLAQAPYSEGKLRFSWRVAVGPAIDRVTAVSVSREDRKLIVRVRDPLWRREVERSLATIEARLASLLGPQVIAGIEIRGEERGTARSAGS